MENKKKIIVELMSRKDLKVIDMADDKLEATCLDLLFFIYKILINENITDEDCVLMIRKIFCQSILSY